jgi:hypothetical protein
VSRCECRTDRDQQDRTHARTALTTYFGHVRDGDWHRAYQQLDEDSNCTEAEYIDFLEKQPRLRSFTVGNPAGLHSNVDGTFVRFPLDLTYANGKRESFDMDVGIDAVLARERRASARLAGGVGRGPSSASYTLSIDP